MKSLLVLREMQSLDSLTQLTASNPQSIRLLPQVGDILTSKSALWAEQVGNHKESSHVLLIKTLNYLGMDKFPDIGI